MYDVTATVAQQCMMTSDQLWTNLHQSLLPHTNL